MKAILRDGEWHLRQDILDAVYPMGISRDIADRTFKNLRDNGTIQHSKHGNKDQYRFVRPDRL